MTSACEHQINGFDNFESQIEDEDFVGRGFFDFAYLPEDLSIACLANF